MNGKQNLKSFVVGSVIAALIAIIITCVIVGIFSLREIINRRDALVYNTLTSAAITVAQAMDGDILQDFQPGDESSALYRKYYDKCRRIAEQIEFEYIYILGKNEHGEYEFIYDTEAGETTYIGDIYEVDYTDDLEAAFSGQIVVSEIYTDEWGTFMSGYAPIYDSTGTIIAIACADYDVGWLKQELSEIISFYILICAGILAVIVTVFAIVISINYKKIKSRLSFVVTSLQDFAKNIEISTNIFDRQSELLSNNATESAGAIAGSVEIAENTSVVIKQTGSDMQQAKAYFSDASRELSDGTARMSGLAKSIKDIEDSSEEIAGVIETINSIAKKTKILALNAEVEAARVGEAGRSFAVVAHEVGDLALSVETAAKNTGAIIRRSKNHTEKAVEDMESVQGIIMSIEKKINDLTGIVTQVSEETLKQTSDVELMLQNISTVRNSVSENAASAQDITASAHELAAMIEHLKEQVDVIKSTIGQTAI